MVAVYIQKLFHANTPEQRKEPTRELVFCSTCNGDHPTSECPTLRSKYFNPGYQGHRYGYEGQNHRFPPPYQYAPRPVAAPLVLPAPLAIVQPTTIVPAQDPRPYAPTRPYHPYTPYLPPVLPP